MKKFICILISILCVASLLCACKSNENPSPEDPNNITQDVPLDTKVVGTWNYVDKSGTVLPDMGGWIFNKDKTGVDTVFNLTFTYETQDGYLLLDYDDDTLGKIETKYKYSVKDNLLTMKREANGAESFTYKNTASE